MGVTGWINKVRCPPHLPGDLPAHPLARSCLTSRRLPCPSPAAGFDAHKKDEINFRYIGVTERDYEWITEQLVGVANRCGACSSSVQATSTCLCPLTSSPPSMPPAHTTLLACLCFPACARLWCCRCCQGRIVSVLEGGYRIQVG